MIEFALKSGSIRADGKEMTIEEVLFALREGEAVKKENKDIEKRFNDWKSTANLYQSNLEKEVAELKAAELKFLNMIKYDIDTIRSNDALYMVFDRIKKLEGGE